jgi:cbb3-type cytochrome oxidase maturation protein
MLMGIIVLLISISLLIAIGFLISFLWSMKNGQFDDTYSPSVRMLFEDKVIDKTVNENKHGKHATPDDLTEKV